MEFYFQLSFIMVFRVYCDFFTVLVIFIFFCWDFSITEAKKTSRKVLRCRKCALYFVFFFFLKAVWDPKRLLYRFLGLYSLIVS